MQLWTCVIQLELHITTPCVSANPTVDSLGGDLAYGIGVSMFAPIPKKEHWPLKLHTFMNIGKCVQYDTDRSFTDNITKMVTNPSVSVGVGLMYR